MANKTKLVISAKARFDLEDIWTYTVSQWSVKQANTYVQNLKSTCQALATKRRIGQSAEDIKPGYLRIHAGLHTIYYTFRHDDALVIERILHQNMNAPTWL